MNGRGCCVRTANTGFLLTSVTHPHPHPQVFFFIDPEILNDPSMDHVHEITLSYTFFKTDEDNQVLC